MQCYRDENDNQNRDKKSERKERRARLGRHVWSMRKDFLLVSSSSSVCVWWIQVLWRSIWLPMLIALTELIAQDIHTTRHNVLNISIATHLIIFNKLHIVCVYWFNMWLLPFRFNFPIAIFRPEKRPCNAHTIDFPTASSIASIFHSIPCQPPSCPLYLSILPPLVWIVCPKSALQHINNIASIHIIIIMIQDNSRWSALNPVN